jgi:hypothetical protein
MKLDKIHTLLGIFFFPCSFLLWYLFKRLGFDNQYLVILVMIYILVIVILGVLTSELSMMNKKIIIWFDTISSFVFLSFVILKSTMIEIIDTQNVYIIFCIWVICCGVVGMMTDTILLTNGKPFIYEKTSKIFKALNVLIMLIGTVMIYFFVTAS